MKKLGWPVVTLVSVVLVVGFLLPGGRRVAGISEGTYTMSAGYEEMVISFNLDQSRFGISNDGGKTWYLQGVFVLNGQIIAITDDGETLLYNGAIFRFNE